jgi:uncharacterized protein (DUF362 family)
MIAEVNQLYRPALVVMDAIRVFVDGGPEWGELAQPEAVVVSRDRIAVDAAGVALLRLEGARGALSDMDVFEQEQLTRAKELELGIQTAEEIDFIADDRRSRNLAMQIQSNMMDSRDKKEEEEP